MAEKLSADKKYLLTVNEAAEYFGIGRNKIRETLDENEKLYVMVGVRKMIKKAEFEKFIDKAYAI